LVILLQLCQIGTVLGWKKEGLLFLKKKKQKDFF